MQFLNLRINPQTPDLGKRVLAFSVALVGLSLVYFFQQFNYAALLGNYHPYTEFVINKTVRYLLNDNLCILIIYALYYKRTYTLMGFYVELFGLVVLLPFYFILKLSLEGETELSSPMLSFIHRLIINPTLMILLIMGMLYQRRTSK